MTGPVQGNWKDYKPVPGSNYHRYRNSAGHEVSDRQYRKARYKDQYGTAYTNEQYRAFRREKSKLKGWEKRYEQAALRWSEKTGKTIGDAKQDSGFKAAWHKINKEWRPGQKYNPSRKGKNNAIHREVMEGLKDVFGDELNDVDVREYVSPKQGE